MRNDYVACHEPIRVVIMRMSDWRELPEGEEALPI